MSILSSQVRAMSIAQMRTSITLEGTDEHSKKLLQQIVDVNDEACHGDKFKARKHIRSPKKNEHTIKGKLYVFPTACTRSQAKSYVAWHGDTFLAQESDMVNN